MIFTDATIARVGIRLRRTGRRLSTIINILLVEGDTLLLERQPIAEEATDLRIVEEEDKRIVILKLGGKRV